MSGVPVNPDASTVPLPAEPAPVKEARPPRVWTVFVVYVLAIVGLFGFQVILAIGALLWVLAQGTPLPHAANRLIEVALTPEGIVGLSMLPTELTILLAALGAAWCSPEPLGARLGLNQPRTSPAMTAVWLVGAIVPFAIGMGAAYSLAEFVPWIPTDPNVAKLYEKMHWGFAVQFVLFIALAPGFAEEFLFRGYMQRRLTRRWPGWVGILVTSILFALVHFMPHAIVFAFVVGVWLGLIAWRTDSVWPGVACHALINGLWNIWQVGRALEAFPAQFPLPLLAAILVLGLAAFSVACWDLATFRRREISR